MAATQQLVGLRRGFSVLTLLAKEEAGLTFNGLQEATDLAPPTLSRLLKVMLDESWLMHNKVTGLYQLGDGAVRFAASVHTPSTREARVQPIIDALALRTKQSTAYFELSGAGLVLLAKHDHPDSFRYIDQYAYTPDLAAHSFGKVILAFMSQPARTRLLAEAVTDPRMSDKAFSALLEEIRRDELFTGIDGCNALLKRVVAPVYEDGRIVGSLGTTSFDLGLGGRDLAIVQAAVRSAAEQAAKRLSTETK